MNYQAATELVPEALTSHLLIAIDLGFASKSKSCGIAWQDISGVEESKSVTFGECVTEVAKLISKRPKVAFIVEAPLSGLFGEDGSPLGRDFEKKSPNPLVKGSRYWYTGPGASICLGAVFFLRALSLEVDPKLSTEILLFEGFVTFKDQTINRTPDNHIYDANWLLECLKAERQFIPFSVNAKPCQKIVSITYILNPIQDQCIAPIVIQPIIP